VNAKPQKIVAGLEPEVKILIFRLQMRFYSNYTKLRQAENHRILLSIKFWERLSLNRKRKNLKKKRLKDHLQQPESKSLILQ